MEQTFPYEAEYNGVPAIYHENGTVLNASTKKIMRPASNTLFSTDRDIDDPNNPIAANLVKQENAVVMAMEALGDGEDGASVAERAMGGWKTVLLAQKRLATMTEKGHASTRAVELLGHATGLMPRNDRVSLHDAAGNAVAGNPAVVISFMERIRAIRESKLSNDDNQAETMVHDDMANSGMDDVIDAGDNDGG